MATSAAEDTGQSRLSELGYKQELKRDLSMLSNFAFSFSIISDASDSESTTKAVYDMEEATTSITSAFDILTEHKMIEPETKGARITFLQLPAARSPPY